MQGSCRMQGGLMRRAAKDLLSCWSLGILRRAIGCERRGERRGEEHGDERGQAAGA